MKRILLFLLFLIINCHLLIATIRYVSHSGSNIPPYLTWETAADSIMSAINISSFGDTIYAANGVYEEQVVMIPGISLIGAGMDSTIIDTRQFIVSWDDIAVEIADSCLLKGFFILAANNSSVGWGIAGDAGENTLLISNKIKNVQIGVFLDKTFFDKADATVSGNICENVEIGVELFNSNSIIKNNNIYTDPNTQASNPSGIHIGAFDNSYTPLIDSNYIMVNGAGGVGIYKSIGSKPTIKNNTIILNPGAGIILSYSDSTKIYNNLILGTGWGIDNYEVEYLQVYNNYIRSEGGSAIIAGPENVIKNNIITGAATGIEKWFNQNPPIVKYNNLWNNLVNQNFSADTTNISFDPMVVNDDSTQEELDFHLQMFSPLIDRGDPAILDKDSSRSDIGLYGGPFGKSYNYLDLPPRTPVNFTAVLDTEYIKLSWNRNTEADFNHYNLYRDTTEGFTIDSSTFVASIEDTFYLQVISPGINNLYFKITSVDNQGNQSEPSEERHIEIVSVKDRPKIFSSYQLYQNYPNPFNPSTKIGYRLKERGYVKLYVYDIKGELVSTLVNKYQEMGYYEVEFYPEIKGQSSDVRSLASGVYIYQIMVKKENNIPVFSDIKKMILLK